MKASDARKLSEANKGKLIPEELTDLIRVAGGRGLTEIEVSAAQWSAYESELKKLGYSIRYCGEEDEWGYLQRMEISW